MFHYLLNLIVFQFRVVSLEYFFDECTTWELNDILENLPYLDRSSWEQSRLQAYVIAQVNTKKKLTQQDVIKFKWEDMKNFMKDEHIKEISTSEIIRLQELSKNFENCKWEDIDAKT